MPKDKEKTYKLVEVNWTDSVSYHGWADLTEIKNEYLVHKSVGYQLSYDDNCIVLAQSIGKLDKFGQVTQIPTCAIASIRELA